MKFIYFKINNLKKIFFLALFCIAIGCSNSDIDSKKNDVDEFYNQLKSSPSSFISKENLPKWLIDRINDYYEIRPPSFCKVLIYKGNWNKQTVYFIIDTFSSFLCDFFTENGERIVNMSDCRATSKNWILIYEYGELVLNLDELFKN
jgi:hypothetical protein